MNHFHLLYVDDDCEKLSTLFEAEAAKLNFEILYCSSIEEGLSTAQEYMSILNGVLLEVNIDNQGDKNFELLDFIVEQMPYIPVFLLANNKDADYDATVDGMRAGAYDCFVKQDLDVPRLFKEFIDIAGHMNEVRKEIGLKNSVTTLVAPPFILYQEPVQPETAEFMAEIEKFQALKDQIFKKKGSKEPQPIIEQVPFVLFQDPIIKEEIHRAVWGYRLISVTKPSSPDDQSAFVSGCIEWHKYFISTIGLIGEGYTYNLKFIDFPVGASKRTDRIEVVLLVIALAKSKALLEARIKSQLSDISLYLHPNKTLSKIFYTIQPIGTEQGLLKYYHASNMSFSAIFQRKVVTDNKSFYKIGFNTTLQENNHHPYVIPTSAGTPDTGPLFSLLLEHEEYNVIDVVLKPTSLTKKEIDSANQVITMVNSETKEDEKIWQFYKNLTKPGSVFFEIGLSLTQNSKEFNNSILSTIASYYFGDTTRCDISFQENFNIYDYPSGSISQTRLQSIYSQEDAINLFRFPFSKFGAMVGLDQIPASWLTYPDNIPEGGINLGVKEVGSKLIPIRIGEDDLKLHTYVMGQTGTGKTTLLSTMMKHLILNGEGVCMIDPHGDLSSEILNFVPPERENDLIFFDPSADPQPYHINILEYDKRYPEQKTVIFNSLMGVMNKTYDMNHVSGPMFELYFKNALFLIMEHEERQGTLMDIIKLFLNSQYREYLLEHSKNSLVKEFWANAQKMSGDISFPNMAPYITSKLNRFTHDSFITPIISELDSNLDFREIIDNKRILIIKIPKGRMGAEGIRFLGTVLFDRILMAAFSRQDISIGQRSPFYLFVDEFQNFTTSDIGPSLSECRKFGLSLILANQTLDQLDNRTLGPLLGNVGNMLFFRPGANDYPKIEPFLQHAFTRHEVVNLPNYHCIAKLNINNEPAAPFIFKSTP